MACTSTVTLGPKANESALIGASAGEEGVNVTVPFVSAGVASSKTSETKSKK